MSVVSFRPTKSISVSARITLQNMQAYYSHYKVDWDLSNVVKQIEGLINLDIYYCGDVVGLVRLEYHGRECYLRDFQILPNYQKKGIGETTLNQIFHLTREKGCEKVILKVFKISQAFSLYQRTGFVIDKEDDRFYYMSRELTGVVR